MEQLEITKIIREILKSHNYGIKMTEDFDNKGSLFTHGIIDSFGLLVFVNELQVKFNFKAENREIHPGNFETIEKIAAFIYNKYNKKED